MIYSFVPLMAVLLLMYDSAHYITIPSLPQSSLHSHRPYGKEGDGCYSKSVHFHHGHMEACIPSVVSALGKLRQKMYLQLCFLTEIVT